MRYRGEISHSGLHDATTTDLEIEELSFTVVS